MRTAYTASDLDCKPNGHIWASAEADLTKLYDNF